MAKDELIPVRFPNVKYTATDISAKTEKPVVFMVGMSATLPKGVSPAYWGGRSGRSFNPGVVIRIATANPDTTPAMELFSNDVIFMAFPADTYETVETEEGTQVRFTNAGMGCSMMMNIQKQLLEFHRDANPAFEDSVPYDVTVKMPVPAIEMLATQILTLLTAPVETFFVKQLAEHVKTFPGTVSDEHRAMIPSMEAITVPEFPKIEGDGEWGVGLRANPVLLPSGVVEVGTPRFKAQHKITLPANVPTSLYGKCSMGRFLCGGQIQFNDPEASVTSPWKGSNVFSMSMIEVLALKLFLSVSEKGDTRTFAGYNNRTLEVRYSDENQWLFIGNFDTVTRTVTLNRKDVNIFIQNLDGWVKTFVSPWFAKELVRFLMHFPAVVGQSDRNKVPGLQALGEAMNLDDTTAEAQSDADKDDAATHLDDGDIPF